MPPRCHKPSVSRTTVRMDARLDGTSRAKEDDPAKHFHHPRAVVVCHITKLANIFWLLHTIGDLG